MNSFYNTDLCDQVTVSSTTEAGASQSKTAVTNETVNQQLNNNNTMSKTNSNPKHNLDMSTLKEMRSKLVGKEKQEPLRKNFHTIDNIFKDDDDSGIILLNDIRDILAETNDLGLEGLALFFMYASEKKQFGLSLVKKDRIGMEYYWATIREGMSVTSFKIPIFPGIDEILKNNNVSIDISLQEIIDKLDTI